MHLIETIFNDTWTPSDTIGYINTVNDETPVSVLGIGTLDYRTLRCVSWAPSIEYYPSYTPLPVQVRFEYRPDTFQKFRKDEGFQAWYQDTDDNIKKGPIVIKKTNHVPTEPVPLDGTGKPIGCDGGGIHLVYKIED